MTPEQEAEAYSFHQRTYFDQPKEVSIETFARCNARCTFCPYPTMDRIGAKLPDEVLERLIAEMERWRLPFWLSLFKVNEPLLDKRVLPLMELVNRRIPKCRLRLFSNGSTLTDANVDRIASLKRLEHLWVSLNEYRKDEYEALMGISWDHTTANLDRLHARDKFPHPVMLSCVGHPNEAFRLYCLERWPKFKSTALKRDAWIDFTNPQNLEVPNGPCWRWFELNITATGKAALCCMDSEARFGFGDVREKSLMEIYNHPVFRGWREKLLSRRTVGSPCNGCSY